MFYFFLYFPSDDHRRRKFKHAHDTHNGSSLKSNQKEISLARQFWSRASKSIPTLKISMYPFATMALSEHVLLPIISARWHLAFLAACCIHALIPIQENQCPATYNISRIQPIGALEELLVFPFCWQFLFWRGVLIVRVFLNWRRRTIQKAIYLIRLTIVSSEIQLPSYIWP